MQVFNTPMLPTKFPYLKYLSISLIGLTNSPAYDYLSLVSFLAASPLLETFFLAVRCYSLFISSCKTIYFGESTNSSILLATSRTGIDIWKFLTYEADSGAPI